MITKQTTQAQRTHQNSGTVRSLGRMATSIGLAVGALLIGLTLFVGRAGAPAQQAARLVEQPPLGRSVVVTGLVFDGQRYTSAPIAVGATRDQPVVGRAMTVTGLKFDGITYHSAPVAVRGTTGLPASSSVQGWPGGTLMGSAYDGQARPVRVAASSSVQGWPGGTLMGSAYNGQTNHALRSSAASPAQGWPGATLTGSAYNGQSAHEVRVTAQPVVQGWPGGTLMGSAYNGQ